MPRYYDDVNNNGGALLDLNIRRGNVSPYSNLVGSDVGNANNRGFENLLQLFMLANQQKPIETANVGGHNLLVTGGNKGINGGLNALASLSQGAMASQQLSRRNQFLQGVQGVAQANLLPEERINQLTSLLAEHGTDYGFGIKDVLNQYNDMAKNGMSGIKAQQDQKRKDLLDSTKIREEFINRPEVKEYTTVNTQVRSMDSLLKRAKEGNVQNKLALDQALITMFNKLTDPNSVVRESEYARTPQNLPLANAFSGALEKLEKGGAGITDKDREALVWGAKVIANERGRTFNETLQGYTDLSNQYGIEPSLVSRGLQPHQDFALGTSTQSTNVFKTEAEATSANLPKGSIVIINGRRARID